MTLHSITRPAGWAITGCIAVFLLSIVLWLDHVQAESQQNAQRSRVLRQLSLVRAATENAVNKRVYLTLGLRAYVSVHPQLGEAEFQAYASALVAQGEGIRSVTLIEGNIITDVYPRAGNEGAIGLELLKTAEQREDARHVIETGASWFSGPIALVQGGEAFINRTPVWTTPPGEKAESGPYWGMVSILIAKEQLLVDVAASIPEDLEVLILSSSLHSEPRERVIFGEASLRSRAPVELRVTLPSGQWQLFGAPKGGWSTASPTTLWLRIAGALLSLVFTGFVHWILLLNRRYASAQAEARMGAAELAIKNEDLEAFVRSASHDLRAPLRQIDRVTEFLKEDAESRLTADDIQDLDRITGIAASMRARLDAILSFCRSGSTQLQRQACDITELVAAIVAELPRDQAACVDCHAMPEVWADPQLVHICLQNIIENALKYNRSAHKRIEISGTTQGKLLRIEIKDNGIGMDEDTLAKIFEPGARGVAGSEFPGTGFGLATCQRIAEAHGTRLVVQSTPGHGSSFTWTLACHPSDD